VLRFSLLIRQSNLGPKLGSNHAEYHAFGPNTTQHQPKRINNIGYSVTIVVQDVVGSIPTGRPISSVALTAVLRALSLPQHRLTSHAPVLNCQHSFQEEPAMTRTVLRLSLISVVCGMACAQSAPPAFKPVRSRSSDRALFRLRLQFSPGGRYA